jgi:hypothetical protein
LPPLVDGALENELEEDAGSVEYKQAFTVSPTMEQGEILDMVKERSMPALRNGGKHESICSGGVLPVFEKSWI